MKAMSLQSKSIWPDGRAPTALEPPLTTDPHDRCSNVKVDACSTCSVVGETGPIQTIDGDWHDDRRKDRGRNQNIDTWMMDASVYGDDDGHGSHGEL